MKRGFTLIELLIVIAIIAILALIAIPNFIEAQTRSKVARVMNDMRSVATALETYFVDHNAYPRARSYPNHQNLRNGYREFCSYLEAVNITIDDGYECVVPLTTPVAYITAFPKDPFMENSHELLSGSDPGNMYGISFLYFNIHGAYHQIQVDASNFGSPPPRIDGYADTVFLNGGSNTQKSRGIRASWGLLSPGPSKTVVYPKIWGSGNVFIDRRLLMREGTWDVMKKGQATSYDPTNGTISLGAIWRFSGGAVE